MRSRFPPPPLWFTFLFAVAAAWCMRSVAGPQSLGLGDRGDGSSVQMAFWPAVIFIASAIWKGLEVAGRVTLAAVAWSVKMLWVFATRVYNGMLVVGKGVAAGFLKTIAFLKDDLGGLLKTAWGKFWTFVDTVKRWLEKTFGPVLAYLKAVRDHLLKFYTDYIRPWLDMIDVTRRALRVLSSLGLKWAAELERRLATIEDRIQAPFLLALRKLNEAIGIINRIVTADGLFQRLAFVQTLARDYKHAASIWWRAVHEPIDDDALRKLTDVSGAKTLAQHAAEFRAVLRDDGGSRSVAVREHVQDFKILVRALRP